MPSERLLQILSQYGAEDDLKDAVLAYWKENDAHRSGFHFSAFDTTMSDPNSITPFGSAKTDGDEDSTMPIPRKVRNEEVWIGPYRYVRRLGSGGMGEVLLVHDPKINRHLAMKIIHERLVGSQSQLVRFIKEAQICAQLQHPNIVPVYDLSRLEDGRVYFTMKEIKGRSLSKAIKALHAAVRDQQWPETGLTFPRMIDIFYQVCQGVAYAHSKGVLHRDIKPENVMLGEFGEVLVVDWGIAKILNQYVPADAEESIQTNDTQSEQVITQAGMVAGTPAYMAPEQARGEIENISFRTDIYALGAILYELLSGKAPYTGSTTDILNQVLLGPPEAITTFSDQPAMDIGLLDFAPVENVGLPIPDELITVCEKAMQRNPKDRFEHVQEMVDAIGEWLDGSTKREQGLSVLSEAHEIEEKLTHLRQDAARLMAEAASELKKIPKWEDESLKGQWWFKETQAALKSIEADRLEAQQEQLLHAALTHKDDLDEARSALASYYRLRHTQAEQHMDSQRAAFYATQLQTHVENLPNGHPKRNDFVSYLNGTGALSVHTVESGVQVYLERYEAHHRRMVPKPFADLGCTPIVAFPLEMGSYRLRLIKPGFHEVIYPIHIARNAHWESRDPDGALRPIVLPKSGAIGNSECFVPAGWFWAGGDQEAAQPLSRRRIWLDDFVMQRHQVTNHEYLQFLNSLVQSGQSDLACRYVPTQRNGQLGSPSSTGYGINSDGQYELSSDIQGEVWQSNWPVVFIDQECALAYASWFQSQSSHKWRLPSELEWEKSARGVDARLYPWGNGFDASYCCMRDSHIGSAKPAEVTDFPIDVSVYGVRGLGGNIRDLTGSKWRDDWDEPEDETVVYRGGSFFFVEQDIRSASRNSDHPNNRHKSIGFRLIRSL